jgi:hypothetical protein
MAPKDNSVQPIRAKTINGAAPSSENCRGHQEDGMPRHFTGLAALCMSLLVSLPVGAQPVGAGEPGSVTAIDILLDPDATMIEHAVAANERLRESFPEGFALGKEHQPHISVLQRYVRTADLDKVYDAVGKVLAEEKPTNWKLKAYKYYCIPWKNIGLALTNPLILDEPESAGESMASA